MAENLAAQMSNASLQWVYLSDFSSHGSQHFRDNIDSDWKDKLNIPVKDSRTQTEVGFRRFKVLCCPADMI
jgi:ATP-dependent RNA helicase DDX6/DHH1